MSRLCLSRSEHGAAHDGGLSVGGLTSSAVGPPANS
jgi:hypothetical protein